MRYGKSIICVIPCLLLFYYLLMATRKNTYDTSHEPIVKHNPKSLEPTVSQRIKVGKHLYGHSGETAIRPLPHLVRNMTNISKVSNAENVAIILSYILHPRGWFLPFGVDKDCPHRCMFTNDTSLYKSSKAVIFFRTLAKRPPQKMPDQKWIYFTNEPPNQVHSMRGIWKKASSKIDWLLSYRPSSDIVFPFGVLQASETSINHNFSSIFSRKQKSVAWLVSHCKTSSGRENYVRELARYIDVDIYGSCGNKQCPSKVNKPEDFTDCKTEISQTYKFYLSFENSLCENYVSEKAFDIYKKGNTMIPVVRGAPNAESFLPKGTFISTKDFESPKQLAKYLKMIGSSEKLFTSLLQKKMSYNLQEWLENFKPAICRLCKMITSNQHLPKNKNIFTKLKEDKCYSPNDLVKTKKLA